MNEESDHLAQRWVMAARRLWPVLVAAAVLGIIVGSLSATRSYTLTTRFLVADNGASLAAAGFKPDDFLRSVSFKSTIQSITSLPEQKSIVNQLGGPLAIEVAVDEPQRVVNVVIRGSAVKTVNRARELLLQHLATARMNAVGAVASTARLSVNERLSATKARITEIDDQLRQLPPASSALGDALRVERTKRGDDVVTGAGELAALDAWSGAAAHDVQDLSTDGPIRSSRLLGPAFGAIGGLALGAGAVAAIALFDQRVRGGADLRRAGLARPLSIVRAKEGRDRDIDSLRLVLEGMAASKGTDEIQLVPVGLSNRAAQVVNDLSHWNTSDDRTRLVARPSLDASTEAVAAGRGSLVVLVVGAGESRPQEVVAAHETLKLAGAEVLGIVLGGVRGTELLAALS